MLNNTKDKINILGQMSGTSCDGIDLALISINNGDPLKNYSLITAQTIPFSNNLKSDLNHLINTQECTLQELNQINIDYTLEVIQGIKSVSKNYEIDLIGFHGQTIYHQPPINNHLGISHQLGILPFISKHVSIPVIGDFRNHDMAFHGNGAPLVPYFDFELFNDERVKQLIVNLGGICNITFLPKSDNYEKCIAGDIGPGNILIDLAVQDLFNIPYDKNGEIASSGKINYALIEKWIAKDTYQKLELPKSTGREHYTVEFLNKLMDSCRLHQMTNEDIIATISQLTVEILLIQAMKLNISELIITGGGAKNKFLMQQIRLESEFKIKDVSEELIDYKEAIVFALLAYQFLMNKPSTLKNTTGISQQTVLGTLSKP